MQQTDMGQLSALLILLSFLVTISTATDHIIYVNQTTLNPTCCNNSLSNITCTAKTFEQALDCVENHWNESVTITLPPGNYILSQNITLQNTSDITIAGEGSPDDVIVTCNDSGAGISFSHSKRIKIENISLSGCGAEHISTSRNLCGQIKCPLLKYKAALCFEYCTNVSLSSVIIDQSNGTGLSFVNSNGTNNIRNSQFSNNVNVSNMPGGNGVNVDLSSSAPGDVKCTEPINDTPSDYISQVNYTFHNCHFLSNKASSGTINPTHIPHNESCCFPFRGGGGMAVYFRGTASENTIVVRNCTFDRNLAEEGGGMYIMFTHKSKNNTVAIRNVSYSSNKCYTENIMAASFATGGGAHVTFTSHSEYNQLLVVHSNFTQNSAIYGGGLSLSSSPSVSKGTRNYVHIRECRFKWNIARNGAAIDMFHEPTSLSESSVVPHLFNCSFTNNGRLYRNNTGSVKHTLGTVNVEHMPAKFNGNITFDRSKGSGLTIQSTKVHFMNNSRVTFTRCTGELGGAISIIGDSACILVYDNTEVEFRDNVATEKGGAIYVDQSKEHYTAYSYSCFIQYYDPPVHPDYWTSSFTFSNNTVRADCHNHNSIFAHSILPCVWPSSTHSTLEEDLLQTLCWSNRWKYDSANCSEQILTSAAMFENSTEYTIDVFPGWPNPLRDITVFDDFNHDVTNLTLFSASDGKNQMNSQYISSNAVLTMHSEPNTSTDVVIETVDTRTLSKQIHVNVLHCPPGFKYDDNDYGSCNCAGTFAETVVCKEVVHRAYILLGYCISYSHNNGKQIIVTRCPFYGFKRSVMPITIIPQKNLTDFCRLFHRHGTLCGECIESHGVSVLSNTYNCIPCNESYKEWLYYFAAITIPLTIFFVLVVLLHIGVTSGPANGFVFFSQAITIPLEALMIQGGWKLILPANKSTTATALTDLLMLPYGIWSLEFSERLRLDICLNRSLRNIHVTTLHYISAVYPLILVGIAYVVIELHARNCKPLVWLWRLFCLPCVRLRRNWQGRTSIIDAFATFILLSYSKFLRVSITLVTPTSIYNVSGATVGRTVNYDSSVMFLQMEHLPYFALAIIILATFGAIPPLLLTLYPFKPSQKYCCMKSQALRTFVEAFHGCYKDGKDGGPDRRYFAGLYFVFRIIVFTIYTVSTSYIAMFASLEIVYILFMLLMVILQPYKKRFYNCLDAFFFGLYASTTAATLYLYARLVTTHKLYKAVFITVYIALFIPMIYMAGYVVYWFVHRSKWFQTHCIPRFRRNTVEEPEYIAVADDERDVLVTQTSISGLPDRLENPQRYEDCSLSYDEITPLQSVNEGDPQQRARNMRQYGSAANAEIF